MLGSIPADVSFVRLIKHKLGSELSAGMLDRKLHVYSGELQLNFRAAFHATQFCG